MKKILLAGLCLIFAGCEVKECVKSEKRMESIMTPIYVSMVGGVPQYTYMFTQEERNHCVEYRNKSEVKK